MGVVIAINERNRDLNEAASAADADACSNEGVIGGSRLARLEEGWVLRYDEAILRRSLHGKIDKHQ